MCSIVVPSLPLSTHFVLFSFLPISEFFQQTIRDPGIAVSFLSSVKKTKWILWVLTHRPDYMTSNSAAKWRKTQKMLRACASTVWIIVVHGIEQGVQSHRSCIPSDLWGHSESCITTGRRRTRHQHLAVTEGRAIGVHAVREGAEENCSLRLKFRAFGKLSENIVFVGKISSKNAEFEGWTLFPFQGNLGATLKSRNLFCRKFCGCQKIATSLNYDDAGYSAFSFLRIVLFSFFSFSKGRAVVIVVLCLFVRLSVTDILWLNSAK